MALRDEFPDWVWLDAAKAVKAFTSATQANAASIQNAALQINQAAANIANVRVAAGLAGGGGQAGGAGAGGGLAAQIAGQLGGGGGQAGAAGAAGGGAGGVMGTAATAIMAVGAAALAVARQLEQMSKEQVRYNRTLAEVSGQMAAVYAESDIRERLRNLEKGDRLAGSARDLTRSGQDFQDNTKEIEIAWNNAKNKLATEWEKFKSYVAKPINEWVKKNINNGPPAERSILMGEWMQAVAKESKERQEAERNMPADRLPDWLPRN